MPSTWGGNQKTWRSRADSLYARPREEAGRENWQAAAVASSASLAALRDGYVEGDVELAREECKLAGLLLRAGDLNRAWECWARATSVLQLFVMAGDPDLEEAEAMTRQLAQSMPCSKTSRPSATQPSSAGPKRKERASQSFADPARTKAGYSNGKFSTASTHGEFYAALAHMCAAMESGQGADSRSAHGAMKAAGLGEATVVSDSFEGVVLGLDSLNLSPIERARLDASLREVVV